jgi:hypothetical protein
MSEYQYYEFQAIDRPLSEKEMGELRSRSTRARISPTSFVNDYSYGNFKGDEDAWMEKYFDAFLYLANWGTHVLKLRLPARLLNEATADLYCVGESASVRQKHGYTIFTFVSEDEEREWVEADGQLSSLISVRSELARSDLRALYLAWLLCAQGGELDDDETEPAVPPGLGELSASLNSFAEFLRIDGDLIAAAALASPPLADIEPKPAEVREWLAKLPVAEKDDILVRAMTGNGGALGCDLLQRMLRERKRDPGTSQGVPERRTVAALLRAAEQVAEERRRIAAAKAAKKKAERERATAEARAKHLDQLAGQEPKLWQDFERLVAAKLPKSYDQAMVLLADLRDLAVRMDETNFRRRIEALRIAHASKRTLIARLDKAGL